MAPLPLEPSESEVESSAYATDEQVATANDSKEELPNNMNEKWSPDNIKAVCDAWSLTEEEKEQLMDAKDKIADINHWKNDPVEVIRFVKGPNGFEENVFRDMIEWRLQNNADTILEDYEPPQVLLDFVPSGVLKGYDKAGDAIYLERAGVMDGAGLLAQFDHDVLIKHIIWLRELATRGAWIEEYKKATGKVPTQVTIIYDLEGLSYSHMKPEVLSLFQEIIQITTSKYIGLAKKMVIIRAPTVFHMIWGVAKYFFKESALERMVFSGPYDYLDVLDKHVDREVLPSTICEEGKGEVVDEMPQGMTGGSLPEPTS